MSDADEEEIKRINELASDLTKQAREGEDFAEMAKKYSVDSISSANGGDLGYFEKGRDRAVVSYLGDYIEDPSSMACSESPGTPSFLDEA